MERLHVVERMHNLNPRHLTFQSAPRTLVRPHLVRGSHAFKKQGTTTGPLNSICDAKLLSFCASTKLCKIIKDKEAKNNSRTQK